MRLCTFVLRLSAFPFVTYTLLSCARPTTPGLTPPILSYVLLDVFECFSRKNVCVDVLV